MPWYNLIPKPKLTIFSVCFSVIFLNAVMILPVLIKGYVYVSLSMDLDKIIHKQILTMVPTWSGFFYVYKEIFCKELISIMQRDHPAISKNRLVTNDDVCKAVSESTYGDSYPVSEFGHFIMEFTKQMVYFAAEGNSKCYFGSILQSRPPCNLVDCVPLFMY